MKRSTVAGMVLLTSVAFVTVVVAQSPDTPQKRPIEKRPAIPDLTPGEGWSEVSIIPESGITARAWSDLAAGCHLAQFALPATEKVGIGPMRSAFDLILAKSNITISDDTSGGLRLTGPDITGLVNLTLVEAPTRSAPPTRSASLLACYWNQREPARCQSICKNVLHGLPRTGLPATSLPKTSLPKTSP